MRRIHLDLRSALVGYAHWLACLPEIVRLAASFCGKIRHLAVFVGAVPDRYPEFPLWLRRCWGIAIAAGMESCKSGEDFTADDLLEDYGCDILLLSDDASDRCRMIEKRARENGISVIFVESDPARGKYLFRRDMRKSVNNYMTFVLGEKPIRGDLLNKDTI